jgi:hypothetical protein
MSTPLPSGEMSFAGFYDSGEMWIAVLPTHDITGMRTEKARRIQAIFSTGKPG